MDKIVEELITNLIKRVERLESEKKQGKPVWKTNPNKQATERQIIAVQNAGGEIWKGMTQGDIEKQFQLINRNKTQRVKKDRIDDSNESYLEARSEAEEDNKENRMSVDVDNQPFEKKLTKEEIEEIGEENLL